MSKGRFTVYNGKLNYVVDYNGNLGDLQNGELVKVWGALRPFSTKIKAEKIITYQTK
jgi:cytochrome c-type biogenesis protein CcmE